MDTFKKQFCINNHDTFICGRYKDGKCKICVKERVKKRQQKIESGIIKPIHSKQFCVRNHDTFIVGRNKEGKCVECLRIRGKEHRKKNKKALNAKQRKFYWDHIEVIKKKQKEYYEAHKDEIKKAVREYVINNIDKVKEREKKFREDHKEELKAKKKKYYQDHMEEIKARVKKWADDNAEALKISRKAYYESHKKEILAQMKAYIKEHPEIHKVASAKNRVKRSQSDVLWGQDGIKEFYKNMPNDMSGDHIIPLVNDYVRGLHVIWNLQYLTPSQNSSKNNNINLLDASVWYGNILKEAGLK